MRLLRRTLSLLRRRNSSDLVLRCFCFFEYTCVFLSSSVDGHFYVLYDIL